MPPSAFLWETSKEFGRGDGKQIKTKYAVRNSLLIDKSLYARLGNDWHDHPRGYRQEDEGTLYNRSACTF